MDFPIEWDKTNNFAIRIYNRCKSYYEAGDEDKFYELYEPSIFFHVFCIFILLYTFVSSILIIIKKEEYKKMKMSLKFSIIFSIGSLINISNYYAKRVFYYKLPCFLVPIINGIGFPLNFFSSVGIILMYLKRCYSNVSIYNKNKTDNLYNKFTNSGYMRRLCLAYSESRLIKTMLIYITLSMNYVIFISLFRIDYEINPMTIGFCSSEYEELPEYILIIFFIFFFSPFVLHDINMFGKSFSIGKTVKISLILVTLCSFVFITSSYSTTYLCSSIIRYLPSDIYMILLFFVFNLSYITSPLIQSYNTKKHINRLVLTKKGLLHIFDDELLYKEFFDYAVKKRSVEYIYFHQDYNEFKELFNSYRTFLDELKENGILSPGPEPTNSRDKKILQVFEEIYSKADEMFTKYFNEDSELQLNIPAKLYKETNAKLYNYNVYYGRYLVNAVEGQPVDFNLINCETIFDKVHAEAIDSLFLNVYSSFTKDKKRLVAEEASNKRKMSIHPPVSRTGSQPSSSSRPSSMRLNSRTFQHTLDTIPSEQV